VDGTPTIYFTDGTRVAGAIDAKMFEEKFAKGK
jgi:protein-disulfide isomerase